MEAVMPARERAAQAVEGYSEEARPLGGHALQALGFSAGVGLLLVQSARRGRLPEAISASDIALLGVATHKISRIVAREQIADFARAPFTRLEGPAKLNEVNQEPRGRGLRRAMGELVACPLCLGAWVAAGLMGGLLFAPRATRAVEATFAGLTISDFLHVAYAEAIDRT
jgi:hypothetical protein